MTVIAVAGGTGGVGKTIVETLLEHSDYEVVVLSRGVRPCIHLFHGEGIDRWQKPKSDSILDKVKQVQVDYDNISSALDILQKHGVETIISAIGISTNETSQAQLNLIQAADRSEVTKRFMPSEYSFIQTDEYARMLFLYPNFQLTMLETSACRSQHQILA